MRDPGDPRWLSHQELRRKQVAPENRRRLLRWQLDRLSLEYQRTWEAEEDLTPTQTQTEQPKE